MREHVHRSEICWIRAREVKLLSGEILIIGGNNSRSPVTPIRAASGPQWSCMRYTIRRSRCSSTALRHTQLAQPISRGNLESHWSFFRLSQPFIASGGCELASTVNQNSPWTQRHWHLVRGHTLEFLCFFDCATGNSAAKSTSKSEQRVKPERYSAWSPRPDASGT